MVKNIWIWKINRKRDCDAVYLCECAFATSWFGWNGKYQRFFFSSVCYYSKSWMICCFQRHRSSLFFTFTLSMRLYWNLNSHEPMRDVCVCVCAVCVWLDKIDAFTSTKERWVKESLRQHRYNIHNIWCVLRNIVNVAWYWIEIHGTYILYTIAP